ncbi:hypothetical protein EZ456_04355 [Pedobacter psychrodurus]|uniref:Uncharacterized protein n=1 Tax=Pedobacter psychrodurus TaxID=2530456 RepID=A0A4V2MS37_9SPHI|nr:hypothetical protein [Pedobacter psychrodurus]TCD28627.1 hypothetical protein EZ456_04355 [Pedobacter psychrodurus]
MKKLIFGMLVAVTAVGGSVATYASTMFNANGKLTPQWYRYNGGSPTDGNNYTATVSLPSECGGSATLCAILAPENPDNLGHPIVEQKTDTEFKN